MKSQLLLTLLFFATMTIHGQTDSTQINIPGNSCSLFLKTKTSLINYSYNEATQTHNYSNNWDFDGDGQKDSLYFIGTGGAHLYYYLRIILSSDLKSRKYNFLNIDFPCLGTRDELKRSDGKLPPLPRFVVDKFDDHPGNKTSNDRIYIQLDNYSEVPRRWRRRGVKTISLVLDFKDGTLLIRDVNDIEING